jgi:hypothetical protein
MSSSDLTLRAACKQGFRRVSLPGENHLDDALLCLVFGYDPCLRIDFKCSAAAGMTHQLLNDFHVFSIADEKRRECVSMPPGE